VLLAGVLAAGRAPSEQDSVEQDVERRFLAAVENYLTLCRRLEQDLPPLEPSSDANVIQLTVEARADAIRRARSTALAGDIFDPAVAEAFRRRVRRSFAGRDRAVARLHDEMSEHGEHWRPAVVNGRFSWQTAAATPLFVLAALPALPAELQYRFVGHDLVLVDITANLIVDILPDAIDATSRNPIQ
jgi:hypothetical protein